MKSFDNENAISQGCQDIMQFLMASCICRTKNYVASSRKTLRRDLLCTDHIYLCFVLDFFFSQIITGQEVKLEYDFHALRWTRKAVQCQDSYCGSLNNQKFLSLYLPYLISVFTFLLFLFKSSKL